MKTLSFLHRWSGGFIGLLLALLGLTGAILVWEDAWVGVPGANDPVIEQVDRLAAISERAAASGAIRITFASDQIGLHQIAKEGGGGAYINQAGVTVASWQSQWERPELWLFDLHHHLFSGETGETVAGIAGIFGLLFVITGSILWWRSRHAFRWRLLPSKFQPGALVAHHRDIGILVAPLLMVSFLTGTAMLFPSATRIVLSPFGSIERPARSPETEPAKGPALLGIMLAQAKTRFPKAELRRLMLPSKRSAGYSVRMRQPFEWNPNGRTALFFDRTGKLLRIDNPAAANRATAINETFYSIHTGKAGGLMWKLAMTLSGLGLTLLGSLACWSFWFRRARRKTARRPLEGLTAELAS
jgi:uncharacterized iron-regulated membrane protein